MTLNESAPSALVLLAAGDRRLRTMEAPPPKFTPACASNQAAALFGIAAHAVAMPSERDQVFQLIAPERSKFILRISNSAEDVDALKFQSAVLLWLRKACPEVPVPDPVPTLAGDFLACHFDRNSRYWIRLFGFIDGTPAAQTIETPELRRCIGTALGRIDLALADFPGSEGANHQIIWDLKNFSAIQQLSKHIRIPRHRRVVEAVLARFQKFADRVPALADQVIHNDVNAKNVLINESYGRVVGIIDFGDIVRSKRIFDLAVTCARQVERTGTIDAACDVIEGYATVISASYEEQEILFPLVMARLAMRIAVRAWRADTSMHFVDVSSVGDAICDLLEQLLALDANAVTHAFRQRFDRGWSFRQTSRVSG